MSLTLNISPIEPFYLQSVDSRQILKRHPSSGIIDSDFTAESENKNSFVCINKRTTEKQIIRNNMWCVSWGCIIRSRMRRGNAEQLTANRSGSQDIPDVVAITNIKGARDDVYWWKFSMEWHANPHPATSVRIERKADLNFGIIAQYKSEHPFLFLYKSTYKGAEYFSISHVRWRPWWSSD